MTSKERMVTALTRGVPDRLPITTRNVMPYFLERFMPGTDTQAFFDHFGLDPITWVLAHKPDERKGDFADPTATGEPGFLEARQAFSDDWRIESESVPSPKYPRTLYRFITPRKTLTMTLESNEYTSWVTDYLIKEPEDVDIIAEFVTHPLCDVEEVNRQVAAYGDRGLVRSHIPCFDVFGQPGCWQDAACLVGIEKLIMATFEDPEWVHTLLEALLARKLTYVKSLAGAKYDVIELGGGDGSTTVISPKLFEQFVAPYDAQVISAAHEAGQRIVYHTCGGMMPILEQIADMGPDAMETFTPPSMGGDTNLAEAKRRIGDRVCMIGGFDQFHYFVGCTPAATRAAVRRAFEEAGSGGGFILAPSDHFFDADLKLLEAFADEGHKCAY